MSVRHAAASALLAALLALPSPGIAEPQPVTLVIPGKPVVTLTADSLAAMPMRDQTISFESHGGETGRYKGVLLWDLIARHSGIDADIKPALRRTILVTAIDGHQVAWSVGDIAPDFGNDPVMLATARDGAPLDTGLRMVVPGDRRGARNIRDVTLIELR